MHANLHTSMLPAAFMWQHASSALCHTQPSYHGNTSTILFQMLLPHHCTLPSAVVLSASAGLPVPQRTCIQNTLSLTVSVFIG